MKIKPTGRAPAAQWIHAALAAVVAAALAVTVLPAQDDLDKIRQAAEQGNSDAQFRLGGMYLFGHGVREDGAEAERWYRLAAEQGEARAQFNLGFMYYFGRGVRKDAVSAHMWFIIADANGNEDARNNRAALERDMFRAQIRRATKLAQACMDSDYKDCER